MRSTFSMVSHFSRNFACALTCQTKEPPYPMIRALGTNYARERYSLLWFYFCSSREYASSSLAWSKTPISEISSRVSTVMSKHGTYIRKIRYLNQKLRESSCRRCRHKLSTKKDSWRKRHMDRYQCSKRNTENSTISAIRARKMSTLFTNKITYSTLCSFCLSRNLWFFWY